jgi:hypothetical protein
LGGPRTYLIQNRHVTVDSIPHHAINRALDTWIAKASKRRLLLHIRVTAKTARVARRAPGDHDSNVVVDSSRDLHYRTGPLAAGRRRQEIPRGISG